MPDRSAWPKQLDVARALDMLGEEEAVRRILATALVVLRDEVPRMRELMQARDVAGVNRILHTIKGMVPVFCGDELVVQVAAAERMSQSATAQAFAPVHAEVDEALARLLRDIAAYLG